eukprot:9171864-Pyramimonas_sp.AAC.3
MRDYLVFQQQVQVLERLALCYPRELCEKDTLREMYEYCREVQLLRDGELAPPAEELRHLEQLHGIFDVALDNNMACYMTHFVDEVRKSRSTLRVWEASERRSPATAISSSIVLTKRFNRPNQLMGAEIAKFADLNHLLCYALFFIVCVCEEGQLSSLFNAQANS